VKAAVVTLNTANVQAGEDVVVLGAGGVGLNSISGALIAGAARIIAIDIADEKLETASSFGATYTINSTTADALAEVMKITGRGVDAVFDFVGLQEVTEQALEMVKPGGGLYLVGMSRAQVSISLDLLSTIGGQRRVQGVYIGSSNVKRDIPMYCEHYLAGRMNLDGLVSREISLDDINAGYETLSDPTTSRVVITAF